MFYPKYGPQHSNFLAENSSSQPTPPIIQKANVATATKPKVPKPHRTSNTSSNANQAGTAVSASTPAPQIVAPAKQEKSVVSAIVVDSSGKTLPQYYSSECPGVWLADDQGNESGKYDSTYNHDTGRLSMSPVPDGHYMLHIGDGCPPVFPASTGNTYYTPGPAPSLDQSVQVSGSDIFLGTLTLPPQQFEAHTSTN
jgi:hypothetical protein